jgi:Beta-propeller repeat/Abnormal spindle-like microcephaly-assoc'd, ASPM-SPD-2-Hydin
VKFLSRGGGYTVFLTQTSAVLVLRDGSTGKSSIEPRQTDPPQTAAHNSDSESLGIKFSKSYKAKAVVRMELVGANPTAHAFGLEDLPGKSNYFLGNDPKKWRTNIPTYAKVKYQNIYPGVDLVYHGSQGRLEYDFVVAPGCDPGVIALEFHSADKIRVDAQDDLVLQLGIGELRLRRPVIYQLLNGMRRSVSGSYVLHDKRFVSFRVEAHDPGKPLVVDPVVVYSTYLGGSSGDDSGSGIAVDSSGNAYVTGSTNSMNFPTANPFQGVFAGGPSDAFVAKLSSSGSTLLYSSYLGGPERDAGTGIAVDSSGNAYLTGPGDSGSFPSVNPFQKTCGGCQRGGPDAFVAKIDATQSGSSSLLYSSFIGGVSQDSGNGIAVDSSGDAYVTGTAGSGFPITPGSVQTSFAGQSIDAFVTKISPNTAPGFTLTSASLAFGNQTFGTTSAPQSVILGNAGTATLTISSVAITGTNSGEFAQNNTCSSSVAGGANCSINVTFAPTTAGPKTAAITINDNAAGSPHILNLIGTGVPVSLSPSSLAFGNQLIGTTSAARVTTLTNIGSANLTITNLTITGSGDFAQSNNCPISPSTLAAGANCTISVTFTPTATLGRNATLTITDNGVGSPHTVPLSGTGTRAAFTISAAPSAATITAGQSTTFTVTVTPGGLTGGPVTLSCSGAPSAASCSLPASVTLNGIAATATATITTTARSIMSPGPAPRNVSPRISLRIGWQWLLLLVTLAMLVRPGRWPCVTFSAAMVLVVLLAFGCGSGNGGTGGGGSSGTPAGTYLLTFTGTASPGVTNNTSVTLTVN